jgi:hypothetical protein
MKHTFKSIVLSAVLAASVIITGCVVTGCAGSATVPGRLVSVTSAGFGVDVASTSTDTGTPHVRLGFFRNTVIVEPVSTNALNAPNFANTFALDQNAKALSFGVNETLASGAYQTAQAGQTNLAPIVTSQPILPK